MAPPPPIPGSPLPAEYESLRRERDELAAFALAGQATVALAHELNNVLNGVALQAAVVQVQVDGKFHPALDVIRRLARQATDILRPLSQSAAERAKAFYPVDVAHAVQEVLRERPALAVRVVLTPAPTPLPPVRGSVSVLKQLVQLLLSSVSTGAQAPLRVRVDAQGTGVELLIDAEDPVRPPTDAVPWDGLGELERLAGQSLLRQLQGALRVEPLPQGGVRVRVCWDGPAAPKSQSSPAV